MTGDKTRILFTAPRLEGALCAPFILEIAQDLCGLGWQVDLAVSGRAQIEDGQVGLCRIPFFGMRRLKDRYDLVHAHRLAPRKDRGHKIAKQCGLPQVISFYGPESAARERHFGGMDAIVADHRATFDALSQVCGKAAVTVIPPGATPCEPDASSPLTRSDYCMDGDRLIVFIGPLSEESGIRTLIDALPLIRKKHAASVLAIGTGIERVDLEMQARKLGVRDQIYFSGAVPKAKLYDYLLLGDALAAPYVTTQERSALAEAMFAGLPVVACASGGIPDMVTNGETGLLVPVRSPDALAAALIRIFDDPAFSHRLAANGRIHAAAHFSRRNAAEKMSALYQDVLSRSTVC